MRQKNGVRDKGLEGGTCYIWRKGGGRGESTDYSSRNTETIRCSRRRGRPEPILARQTLSPVILIPKHNGAGVPRNGRTALRAVLRRPPCSRPRKRATRARRYLPRRHESCGFQAPGKQIRRQGTGGRVRRAGKENQKRKEKVGGFVEAGNTLP